MTKSAALWKESLKDSINAEWSRDIDDFEKEILLKKQGTISDQVFAETRLRKGAYGQRYDNGIRYNGKESVKIPFPNSDLFKGPGTYWHAPGMLRIKIPFGGINPEQMEVMAELAEEYSDSIIHITTRQDIQLHYIQIDNTPTIFRRLAAVDITTTEACGNSIRNVTACPTAGVCKDQSFDVSAYANATFRYMLGHPDAQDFGRKFKISFSGCKQNPCGLANMHDMGLIAITRETEAGVERGFEVYVGGGLGAVPYNAKLLGEFISEQEILPTLQAVCRVYQRLGEKKKRHMARIKFLVEKLGIEEFSRLVKSERESLKDDEKWTLYLNDLDKFNEEGLPITKPDFDFAPQGLQDPDFARFCETNIEEQRQPGYYVVHVNLPLGDATPSQFRALADIGRKYNRGTFRTTVEQNLLIRWIRGEDLYGLYQDLKANHLADSGIGTIVDITACPGTDTCKLGISSSRGLAGVLSSHLTAKAKDLDPAVRSLKIKASGCFNSCSQHHLADIGFYGTNRIVNGFAVPHFQLVLGGEFKHNGRSYGIAVGNYPSKAILKVVDDLTAFFSREKNPQETFKEFVGRQGKKSIASLLEPHTQVPLYEENPGYYTDWGDVREFSMKDKGIGECAGEVVTPTDFGLKTADREFFEAQLLVDDHQFQKAGELALQSMRHAAQALVKYVDPDITEDPTAIMEQFVKHFHKSGLVHDPFGGERFVQYYLHAQENAGESFNQEQSQRRVEEARLFVESVHNCNIKIANKGLEKLREELAANA